MDSTLNSRQQKFRQGMKEAGKRQRSFFLTEQAMEALQQYKENIQAPSLNHALEHMLTSIAMSLETADQISQNHEPAHQQNDRLNAIAAQAQCTSEAFREAQRTLSNESGKRWKSESAKLALLIDPSKPIAKKPLP